MYRCANENIVQCILLATQTLYHLRDISECEWINDWLKIGTRQCKKCWEWLINNKKCWEWLINNKKCWECSVVK